MRFRTLVATLLFCAAPAMAALNYDDYFTTRTMRVDYFHTGNKGEEIFALDEVVADGPWPGSHTRLVDTMNLGKYFFEVIDTESKKTIYSRGFASIYSEWEDTDEAKQKPSTFHESLRFPWPKKSVQIVLKKRDKKEQFQQVWSTTVDPNSRFVNAADFRPVGVRTFTVFENGVAADKVDLLVIGEGYTDIELQKFQGDINRLIGKLFDTEPFKSRKRDFNVRAMMLPAWQSGVNRPRTGDFRRTPSGVEYNIFDVERYVLTKDNRALRNLASALPYDFLEILVNEKTYGGGGIFMDQATASVDSAFSAYVFVHEFGHHFAGLGDEYYTSDVAQTTGGEKHPEPWEPNLTANAAHPKWEAMADKDVPRPTPWKKEEFETHQREYQAERRKLREANVPEEKMDDLFRREQEWETQKLGAEKYAGKVGAFEGAAYEAKGLYRPQVDCIMFTRDEVGFCRVCSNAIERIIDEYSR